MKSSSFLTIRYFSSTKASSPNTKGTKLVNSAGVLLITQAILVLQPTATPKQKTTGTHIHFGLNLAGTVALIAGLIIIEMNKASHPETRFQSPHGVMGLVTLILIIVQALIGFAQFYIPSTVLGSVENGKKLYTYHRMSGYVILLMLLATVCAATQTDFNKNKLHIRLWAVLVASILVVVGVVPRIKKHKFGF
jgi:Eukaryotic cytochrome b561